MSFAQNWIVNSVLKRKKGFLIFNPISIFLKFIFLFRSQNKYWLCFREIFIILSVLGLIYWFVCGNISFSEANIINDVLFLSQYVFNINNLDMKRHHHSLFLSLSFSNYSTSEKIMPKILWRNTIQSYKMIYVQINYQLSECKYILCKSVLIYLHVVSYPNTKATCEKISKQLVINKNDKTGFLLVLWGKLQLNYIILL